MIFLGRRTRAANQQATTNDAAKTTNVMTDDQYCASPKRKDCKLDKTGSPIAITANTRRGSNGNKSNAKFKSPQAITNFFRLESRAKSLDTTDEHADYAKMPNGNHDDKSTKLDDEPAKMTVESMDALVNSDSNSCDSGVVQDIALAAGIKPSTPHRIVCPSSPAKRKQRLEKTAMTGFSNLNINDKKSPKNANTAPAGRKGGKSKRRLNVIEVENATAQAVSTVEVPPEKVTTTNSAVVANERKTILTNAQQNSSNKPFAKPKAPVQNAPQQPQTNQLTDYFPIRRSVRKTKYEVEREHLRSIEVAIEKQLEDGLVVKDFEEKGRGIVAGRPFVRGEFVIEYIGELIEPAEADRREEDYAKDPDFGCYMYYFKYKNQQWWWVRN